MRATLFEGVRVRRTRYDNDVWGGNGTVASALATMQWSYWRVMGFNLALAAAGIAIGMWLLTL